MPALHFSIYESKFFWPQSVPVHNIGVDHFLGVLRLVHNLHIRFTDGRLSPADQW